VPRRCLALDRGIVLWALAPIKYAVVAYNTHNTMPDGANVVKERRLKSLSGAPITPRR
jgi:hypothetical protein